MKTLKTISIILSLVIAIGFATYFISCDNNPPTGPEPVTDYPVYFWDTYGDDHKFYTYYPNRKVIDSVNIPWSSGSWVQVSADGKRLYLDQVNSIVVIDTDSMEFITELPYKSGKPVVSPDNKLIAIQPDGMLILNTDDYSVFYQDTIEVYNGTFTADSKTFVGRLPNSPEPPAIRICTYNLNVTPPEVSYKGFSDRGKLRTMTITPDGNKWLMYSLRSFSLHFFWVYDVALDSVIYEHFLITGYGQVAVSGDSRYAFYSNPGRDAVLTGNDSLYIYDIENNRLDETVEIYFTLDSLPMPIPVGQMVVTPDNRWLIGKDNGFSGVGGQVIFSLDIEKKEAVDIHNIGFHNVALTNITVQNAK